MLKIKISTSPLQQKNPMNCWLTKERYVSQIRHVLILALFSGTNLLKGKSQQISLVIFNKNLKNPCTLITQSK